MCGGLAMTPSRPAPSNSENHRCAVAMSVVAGVTWIDRSASAPEPVTASTRAARLSLNGRPALIAATSSGK
ncbi:Uncharacterised protein [Mycobacterium tuberculosis]|nr:Uncharacterised protein [Mycobacterium tuberculosis]